MIYIFISSFVFMFEILLCASPHNHRYCLYVSATGNWSITAGKTKGVIASGSVPGQFDPSQWHSLSLVTKGSAVTGFVDGVQVRGASCTMRGRS